MKLFMRTWCSGGMLFLSGLCYASVEVVEPVNTPVSQEVTVEQHAAAPAQKSAAQKAEEALPQLPPMPVFKSVVIPPYRGPLSGLSAQQAYDYLKAFMVAQDVKGMVKLMKGVDLHKTQSILELILTQKNESLTPHDKTRLILGLVATYFSAEKTAYTQLFDLLVRYNIQQEVPLPLLAARYGYVHAIEPLLMWVDGVAKKQKKTAFGLQHSGIQALQYAVRTNDQSNASVLLRNGVSLTQEQATHLLVAAAGVSHATVSFIPLLIKAGAAINGVVKGYTPLMQATVVGNLPFVAALLKAGAQIEYCADPAVGTALQLSMENKQYAVEEFLRAHGAQED